MNRSLLLASIAVSASLAACKKKEAPTEPAKTTNTAPATGSAPAAAAPAAAPAAAGAAVASCMNPSKSTCTNYPDAEAAKMQCELISGTFSAAPCDAKGKLGSCTLGNRKQLTYYPGGEDALDAKLAQTDCTGMSGTWIP